MKYLSIGSIEQEAESLARLSTSIFEWRLFLFTIELVSKAHRKIWHV